TNSSCNIRNFPITEVSVKFNGREKINFIEFKLNNGTLSSCGYFIDRPYYSPINCGKDCDPRSAHMFNFLVPDTTIKNISSVLVPFMNNIQPHRLSWIYVGKSAATNDPAIDAVGCAWTHPSVDNQNMLTSNAITQIPAVMAHVLEGDANVVKGSGNTGGDLVRLGPNSKMLLKITLPLVNKEYRVRIRCANQKAGDLFLSTGWDHGKIHIPSNQNYKHTLNYSSFQVIAAPEFITLSVKQTTQYTIQLANTTEEIFIDKIDYFAR
ncbi:delta endotoxin C-terminal domain-containing protein, partial [Escherichia sp. SP-MK2]